MRKRFIGLCAALMLALSAHACATQVMGVSDIHYMAKELYEDSDLFLRALRAGDGKLTQHSDELMEALCREVERRGPDALIVTGDLSFNGERASHLALAKWFARIEGEGTPVWVIPGNHDINVSTARGFRGDEWYYTNTVTPEEFSAIYGDFMLPPEGAANLSYAVQVDERLRIAMTDAAFYQDGAQTFGLFTAGHAAWLERVLEEAEGAEVVTASHHNLLPHTQFSRESFVMFGSETMAGVMVKRGVRLNLSGHIHAQHIAREGDLTDAALGAFCAWPHRYALLTLEDDGTLVYEAESLDDALLPEGFLEASRAWFFGIAREKTRAAIADVEGDEGDAMADYVARFNLAYFSGTYRSDDPSWKDDPAYGLWLGHRDSPYWQYLDMVMNEPNGDNLYCRVE